MSEKMALSSKDILAEKIALLRQEFPEVFTEGKIDFDKLKEALGEEVSIDRERYGLSWAGKSEAIRNVQTPSVGTLVPDRGESANFDTTENLFIEGDNLEVLKLLQKSYHGRVKMIYIDPPYNTGHQFIYPDNFREGLEDYLRYSGRVTGDGFKLSTNTETSGRYHSKWLNMMYPRLFLARNLLREDGVIFVSIDDHEVHNLRLLMDEIFGEVNFVASIVWQKKYAVSNDDRGIGVMHDYIVVFSRSSDFERGLFPRSAKQEARYSNPDNDPRGDWTSGEYLSGKTKEERPTLYYPIIHPRTKEKIWPPEHAVWRYSPERHAELEQDGRLYWGPDQNYQFPRLKRFKSEMREGVVPSTWWPHTEAGHNDEAGKQLATLMERPRVFSNGQPRLSIDSGCRQRTHPTGHKEAEQRGRRQAQVRG
jgi:adenine-specific DNA-methyltransferase